MGECLLRCGLCGHRQRVAFGHDCAGAVSVVDPEKSEIAIDPYFTETLAALQSRASLSGVQPKVFVVKTQNRFRAAMPGELSTHIAKLPSKAHADLIEVEWLTTKAMRALLPGEPVVDLEIDDLPGVAGEALMIKRFDRTNEMERIHFEEFNTLLGNRAIDKYEGSYEQMGSFIQHERVCIPAERERLYRRILACFLLGNMDAHLKNFAMSHVGGGLRLSPAYDLVASAVYKEYTISLSVSGASNLRLSDLMPKHLLRMASGFGLSEEVVMLAVEDFRKRRGAMTEAIYADPVASTPIKLDLLILVDKRWNRTFELVGTVLSKKRKGGEKLKGFRKCG